MKSNLILVLVAMAASSAQATTFGLHLGSVHSPSESYQNNVNPGVYVRTDEGITAGMYHNTLGRVTVYAGATLEYGPFGVMAGVATGYKPKVIDGRTYGQGHTLTPVLAFSLSLPAIATITPKLIFIPAFQKGPAVFHLAIEKRF
ncbi:hypothetical protein [Polaromonas sp.]|uniref:hypothetical protein n=1 Tax=Polaromonas sp. TaxID=1869339 RepID=UPI003751DBDB